MVRFSSTLHFKASSLTTDGFQFHVFFRFMMYLLNTEFLFIHLRKINIGLKNQWNNVTSLWILDNTESVLQIILLVLLL